MHAKTFAILSLLIIHAACVVNTIPTSGHIDSCVILSARTNYSDGFYCVQDEYNTNSLQSLVNPIDAGVAISVGSIRALSLIALAKVNYGLMIDYDEAVVEFNVILKNLILATAHIQNTSAREQRLNFISLLGGYWLNAHDLENTSISPRDEVIHLLNTQLLEKKVDNTFKARYGIVDHLDNLPAALKEPYEALLAFRSNLKKSPHDTRAQRIKELIVSLANYYGADAAGSNMENEPFFWESDQQWNRLVNLFENNKISILNGDLGNRPLLASISNCLKETKHNLALVDVSSAFESLEFLDRNQINILLDFIESSPKHSQAQLIFTSHHNQTPSIGLRLIKTGIAPKNWRYFGFELSKIDALRKFLAAYQHYNVQ